MRYSRTHKKYTSYMSAECTHAPLNKERDSRLLLFSMFIHISESVTKRDILKFPEAYYYLMHIPRCCKYDLFIRSARVGNTKLVSELLADNVSPYYRQYRGLRKAIECNHTDVVYAIIMNDPHIYNISLGISLFVWNLRLFLGILSRYPRQTLDDNYNTLSQFFLMKSLEPEHFFVANPFAQFTLACVYWGMRFIIFIGSMQQTYKYYILPPVDQYKVLLTTDLYNHFEGIGSLVMTLIFASIIGIDYNFYVKMVLLTVFILWNLRGRMFLDRVYWGIDVANE